MQKRSDTTEYSSQDRLLDTIMARGRLSGPTRDHILAEVMAAQGQERQRPRLRQAVAGLTALAAALLCVWGLHLQQPTEGMQARGTAGLFLEASCADVCRPGATLLIRLQGLAQPGYLAAAITDPTGHTFWIYPANGSAMPLLAATDEPALLPQGLQIDQRFAPGRYTLRAVLLDTPVDAGQASESLFSHADPRNSAEASFTVAP